MQIDVGLGSGSMWHPSVGDVRIGMGLLSCRTGLAKWAMRVTLAQSRSVSELKQRWGEVQVEKVGDKEMFVRGDIAFYLPKHRSWKRIRFPVLFSAGRMV